jgi:hypothetical protein
MEGIENQHPSSLRVMRFGFEPNLILLEQLRTQLEPTRRLSTPLRLYASSQLLISLEDYYEHEDDIFTIGQEFSARRAGLGIMPRLDSKELPKTLLSRLRLQPTAQEEFDAMIAKVNLLPNSIQQPTEGHYVFVDVATHALLAGSERKVARDRFSKVGKRLRYTVEPTRFVIQRDIPLSSIHQPKLSPTPLDDLPRTI